MLNALKKKYRAELYEVKMTWNILFLKCSFKDFKKKKAKQNLKDIRRQTQRKLVIVFRKIFYALFLHFRLFLGKFPWSFILVGRVT